jgi:hypothetical protein
MRQWLFALGGLLVWTAHFFAVYIAASLFPGEPLASWLTLSLTVIALIVAGWLGLHAWRVWQARGEDDLTPWLGGIALMGAALSAIAILYEGLTAVFF